MKKLTIRSATNSFKMQGPFKLQSLPQNFDRGSLQTFLIFLKVPINQVKCLLFLVLEIQEVFLITIILNKTQNWRAQSIRLNQRWLKMNKKSIFINAQVFCRKTLFLLRLNLICFTLTKHSKRNLSLLRSVFYILNKETLAKRRS